MYSCIKPVQQFHERCATQRFPSPSMVLIFLVTICLGGALSSCSSHHSDDESLDNGTLRMALQSSGPDGTVYHLQNAVFEISGDTSQSLSSEEDAVDLLLTASLPAGNYTITLLPGWTMERVDTDATEVVEATLVSDNPIAFSIFPSNVTDVTFIFEVNGVEVPLAPGTLDVHMQVQLATCDPLTQTGCQNGERCTLVPNDDASDWELGCTAEGTLQIGDECTFAVPDACEAGSLCVEGQCTEICDYSSPAGGCNCIYYDGYFLTDANLGFCANNCNIFLQDCSLSGQGCYLNAFSGEAACFTPSISDDQLNGGTQGDSCMYLNSCSPGYGCLGAPNTGEPMCQFYCNPNDPSFSCEPGPGADFTCTALNSIYSNTTMPDDIGICVAP